MIFVIVAILIGVFADDYYWGLMLVAALAVVGQLLQLPQNLQVFSDRRGQAVSAAAVGAMVSFAIGAVAYSVSYLAFDWLFAGG